MTRTRTAVTEILRNLLLLALPLGLVFTGQYYLAGGIPAVLRSLILVPLYFVTLPMRQIRHRVWKFVLPCVVYLIAIFQIGLLLPSHPPEQYLAGLPLLASIQAVFFFAFAFYAVMVSVYERLSRPAIITGGYLLACEALYFVLYLTTASQSSLRVVLHILAVVFLMLFIIHMQMGNFDSAMHRYALSGQQPVDRISRSGNRMLTGFLATLAVVALIAPYGAAIVNAILRAGLAVIRYLAGFLDFGDETLVTDPTAAPTEPDIGPGGLPSGESGLFGKILAFILELLVYVVMAAVVVGLIALTGYIIYSIYKKFYGDRSVDGDVLTRLARTKSSATRTADKAARARRPRGGLGATPAERIRHIFMRTVEGSVKTGRVKVQESDTAGIISDKIARGMERDVSPLTKLYEKARYGPDGAVSRDDVRDARHAAAGRGGDKPADDGRA